MFLAIFFTVSISGVPNEDELREAEPEVRDKEEHPCWKRIE